MTKVFRGIVWVLRLASPKAFKFRSKRSAGGWPDLPTD